MPYRELVEGNQFIRGTTSITGTRIFIDDSAGSTSDLPALGTPFDASTASAICLLTNIRSAPFGGLSDKKIYICEYTSERRSSTPTIIGGNKNMTNLPTFMEIGMETMVLDPVDTTDEATQLENAAFKWSELSDAADSTSDKVYQPVFKIIPTGILTVQQEVGDIDEFNAVAIPIVGCVNAAEFKGFPAECVQYVGHTAEEQANGDNGEKKWLITMRFAWRIVQMPAGSGTTRGGWNHFWRRDYTSGQSPNDVGWQRILYRQTNENIYPSTDFSALIQ